MTVLVSILPWVYSELFLPQRKPAYLQPQAN